MIQKFPLFLLCFLSVFSLAKAQQTLGKIPSGKVLSVAFTQYRHLKSIPTPLTSIGTLKLLPQRGLIWNTKKPFPNTLVMTKKGLFQQRDGDLIPLTKGPQSTFIFDLLSKVLEGDFQNSLDAFEIENIPSKEAQWAVQLTPKDQQLKEMLRTIDIYGTTQTSLVIIHRSNGDYDEIHFENHKIMDEKKALNSQEIGWLYDK